MTGIPKATAGVFFHPAENFFSILNAECACRQTITSFEQTAGH
jgi:hypothetical protein